MHSLMIIDLEATCCKDKSIPKQEREIIEIGAVVFDEDLSGVTSEFQSYIKPVRHPLLTDFCTRLTGITQEQVAAARPFPEIFREFSEWAMSFSGLVLLHWGSYDRKALQADCNHHGVEYKLPKTSYDFKKMFYREMNMSPRRGLRDTLLNIGLEFEGRAHSALADAKNTARLLKILLERKTDCFASEPVWNANRSVTFTVGDDYCIAKIMEKQIHENMQGANARNAFDLMVMEGKPLNIVDFGDSVYINNGAWGNFLLLMLKMNRRGGIVRLTGMTAPIAERYRLTRMYDAFPAHETVEDAIRAGAEPGDSAGERYQQAEINKFRRAGHVYSGSTRGFCKTLYSRRILRDGFDLARMRIPPFDEAGLIRSIGHISGMASRISDVLPVLQKITETFLWPPTAAALILRERKRDGHFYYGYNLPYTLGYKDFKFEQKKSLESYSLETQKDIFIADTGVNSKTITLCAMEGEAVQDTKGDFPEFQILDQDKLQLDCSLISKDPVIFHQGVILSLETKSEKGMIVFGFREQAFGNGAYPLTKFDRAWFFKLMKMEVAKVIGREMG